MSGITITICIGPPSAVVPLQRQAVIFSADSIQQRVLISPFFSDTVFLDGVILETPCRFFRLFE